MIDYDVDGEGIASLIWNMDRSMNVLNDASLTIFESQVRRALADEKVHGVLIGSAKRDFIAGADLEHILTLCEPQDLFTFSRRMQTLLRLIETAAKPFIAVIDGLALGGGFELCLACHRRIASDQNGTKVGLPEASLGLVPGGGGTQRLARMLGVRAALPLLLEGRTLSAAEAQAKGLVDKVAPAAELMSTARSWLLANQAADFTKPWDRKGYTLPGGPVQDLANQQFFIQQNALWHARSGPGFLAARNILGAVHDGADADVETGMRIEARYFANSAVSSQAKNIIRTRFFSIGEARKLVSRPKDVPQKTYKKLGVLGAGMMGSGIAYVAARAGLKVILLDQDIDSAERGKAYSQRVLERESARGRITADQIATLLERITPTVAYTDLTGCDIVIEAVFEDPQLKADVTRQAEEVLTPGTLFASNTSSIPITRLAMASQRPTDFIGLHFFSPVDQMPLVEVILGQQTSERCLAHALDLLKRLGMTPIVVRDARGFYTSRVVNVFLSEGMKLLQEGVAPALIENAARGAGMPVGPLALADEVALSLMLSIRTSAQADMGADFVRDSSQDVLEKMVLTLERSGRKNGGGFYDYPDNAKKRLWPELVEYFPPAATQPDVQDVADRLMLLQSLETVRCLQEGVLLQPQDGDIGSVLGWGFPAALGGTMGLVHSMGIAAFVHRCKELERDHGERFQPPSILEEMQSQGRSFFAA